MNESEHFEHLVIDLLKDGSNLTDEDLSTKLRVSRSFITSLCGQLSYKGIIKRVKIMNKPLENKLNFDHYQNNDHISDLDAQITVEKLDAEIGLDAETLKDPIKLLKWIKERKAIEDTEKELGRKLNKS